MFKNRALYLIIRRSRYKLTQLHYVVNKKFVRHFLFIALKIQAKQVASPTDHN